MRPQPMIVVRNVPASSAWYQRVLGANGGHGGEEYEMIMVDGRMILQLHKWEAHEHPFMGRPPQESDGNGALLWFQADRFDEAWARIAASGAKVLEGPLLNPNAQHREVWLCDPDGYTVVVCGPYGDL